MAVITINGCRVAPADVGALRELLGAYIEELRAREAGCLHARVLVEAEDPCAVIVYAEFRDEEAYAEHLSWSHVAALRSRRHPLIGDTHHKTIYRAFVG